ncbi:MAG: accessory gene regulator B family protein, partial [Clostridiales bacterium]|nr:accessory gene regulator B family protein [Clostridiales bacterium]
MKQLSAYLADQMYVYRLIEEDDQRYYSYSLQLIIEKIVVTVLICLFAILFKRLGEILLFLLVFSVIRMNSDGIHCKTS